MFHGGVSWGCFIGVFHTLVAQCWVLVRVLMAGCCSASIDGVSGVAAAAASAAAVAVTAIAAAAAYSVFVCGVGWEEFFFVGFFQKVFHRVFHRCFTFRGVAGQRDAAVATGR